MGKTSNFRNANSEFWKKKKKNANLCLISFKQIVLGGEESVLKNRVTVVV